MEMSDLPILMAQQSIRISSWKYLVILMYQDQGGSRW